MYQRGEFVSRHSEGCTNLIFSSAAGKILRRELREKAKAELAGADPATHYFKTKL